MPELSYPGVYIDEVSTGGPIAGVGTSTVAFIGPALGGRHFKPTKVTNWTDFQNRFGSYRDRTFMAHSVRGFFDNGGTVAYIVRVGTEVRASVELADRGTPAGKSLRLESRLEGQAGNAITVSVEDAELAKTTVQRPRVTITAVEGQSVTLADAADAAKFQIGDVVTIEETDARAEIRKIERGIIILDKPQATRNTEGFLRIADLVAGQRRLRLAGMAGVEPGTVLKLARARSSETVVVDGVAGSFVTLAVGGLKNAYKLGKDDADVAVTSVEFTLKITGPKEGDKPEEFAGLSMDHRHRRYWEEVVRSAYVDVMLPELASGQSAPGNHPALVSAAPMKQVGENEGAELPGFAEYKRGIDSLDSILDVQLVCAPDGTTQAIQQEIVRHCEKLGDRFAILDPAQGLPPDEALLVQRGWCVSAKGFASFYYPWLSITRPSGKGSMLVPPSGHIAGIFARVDSQRGVHKAPANEYISGALGLETIVDNTQQGQLNNKGVNVLRVFPGETRPIVWGVRTTSDGTEWMHNSVRRLFIFVETSLKLGLRPWVFEPNNIALWKKMERTITEFLTRVWRSGALFGRKASEAFYVKIDEELNPPDVRALGQVFIEVGMAPVHPAEFIVVRIGIWDGGVSISQV